MNDTDHLLILSAFAVRDRGVPLRRFLEARPLPENGRVRHVATQWYENDEELEERHFRRHVSRAERVARTLHFLLRHLSEVRQARAIYCLDGAHFAGLVLLSRARVFNASGKTVRRYAFHDHLAVSIAPRLLPAAPAFQIEMITHSQVRRAQEKLGGERVVLRPWKIDLEWYRPQISPPRADSFLLCPGNIRRAESLLPSLLDQNPSWRMIRASRSPRDINHPRCEVKVNTPHAEYLGLLQQARYALLPIEACDEPAGLTAAMEAIATHTPVLANASLGISELFEECDYPLPLVPDLKPESWARAICEAESQMRNPDFHQALARSRKKMAARRGILPEGGDWNDMMREMLERHTQAAPARAASEPLHA
jgi:hypothetical protein